MDDDEYFDSDLFDDVGDIINCYGNDHSMGGRFVDEVEADPNDSNTVDVTKVGRWPPDLLGWEDKHACNIHPKLEFNKAGDFSYEQAKKEVEYLVERNMGVII